MVNPIAIEHMHFSDISFENITTEHLRRSFYVALKYFPGLHDRIIIIRKKDTGGATMTARPVVNRFLFYKRKRHFLISINPIIKVDDKTPIEAVPEKVLTGWFAHELGHIVDYLDRSGWDLIRFGIYYSLSETFRIGAERKADVYAIGHGCADYILTTKKYILEHSDISNAYKTRIEKYYMSPDELAIMLNEQAHEAVQMDDVEFWK